MSVTLNIAEKNGSNYNFAYNQDKGEDQGKDIIKALSKSKSRLGAKQEPIGQIAFTVNNKTSYILKIVSSNKNSAVVNPGASKTLLFNEWDTNITNAMRWYKVSDPGLTFCILQGSVNWSAAGCGADNGSAADDASIICMDGSMTDPDENYDTFYGCTEGWNELQPWNLMANGGSVDVTYTNA
jgi:hypothetical protein